MVLYLTLVTPRYIQSLTIEMLQVVRLSVSDPSCAKSKYVVLLRSQLLTLATRFAGLRRYSKVLRWWHTIVLTVGEDKVRLLLLPGVPGARCVGEGVCATWLSDGNPDCQDFNVNLSWGWFSTSSQPSAKVPAHSHIKRLFWTSETELSDERLKQW